MERSFDIFGWAGVLLFLPAEKITKKLSFGTGILHTVAVRALAPVPRDLLEEVVDQWLQGFVRFGRIEPRKLFGEDKEMPTLSEDLRFWDSQKIQID